MKKLILFPVIAMLAIPALAHSSRTTTTRTYDSEMTSEPVESDVGAGMIEAEEEGYDDSTLDAEDVDQQRMEERNQNSSITTESEDAIDYSDRTRTNRERKALNTGGDASDDQ